MSFPQILFNHKESKAMAKSVTFKLKRGQSVTLGGITLAAVWAGHEGKEPNLTPSVTSAADMTADVSDTPEVVVDPAK